VVGRQTHPSTEFRAEAVRLAETSGQSVRQVAHDLGISNENLRRWIVRARERPAGPPLDDDERAELTELHRRVKVLDTEREILGVSPSSTTPGGHRGPSARECVVTVPCLVRPTADPSVDSRSGWAASPPSHSCH
jgi:transposase